MSIDSTILKLLLIFIGVSKIPKIINLKLNVTSNT